MSHFSGSCLCGAVAYHVSGNPVYSAYCHCSQCRKFSGSAFSALMGVPRAQLRVEEKVVGAVGAFQKSEATRLMFCRHCGSSLFAEKVLQGLYHVRMGTLDGTVPFRPQAHIHVASKASWYDLPDDGLPRFEESPPKAAVESLVRAVA